MMAPITKTIGLKNRYKLFTHVSPTGFEDRSPNSRLPIYQPSGLKNMMAPITKTIGLKNRYKLFTHVSPTGFEDHSPNLRLPIYQPSGLKNKFTNNYKAQRADISVDDKLYNIDEARRADISVKIYSCK